MANRWSQRVNSRPGSMTLVLIGGTLLPFLSAQFLWADNRFVHAPRGAFGVLENGPKNKMVDWIGHDSINMPLPSIESDTN